jgi:hypothetical protein
MAARSGFKFTIKTTVFVPAEDGTPEAIQKAALRAQVAGDDIEHQAESAEGAEVEIERGAPQFVSRRSTAAAA